MPASTTQLPLSLNPQQQFSFNNFYFQQTELQQALHSLCQSKTKAFLYLWGRASSGKTHLLLAASQQSEQPSLYLPLADLVQTASPEILNSIAHYDLICIDDLDAIFTSKDWQEALFHCFNLLQHTPCKLLISASTTPLNLPLKLADLRSRMSTALIYNLDPLKDRDKQKAMILQAASIGLELSEKVAQYVLHHHSRDMAQLLKLLSILDKESLAEQRRITIPFVRQTLDSI